MTVAHPNSRDGSDDAPPITRRSATCKMLTIGPRANTLASVTGSSPSAPTAPARECSPSTTRARSARRVIDLHAGAAKTKQRIVLRQRRCVSVDDDRRAIWPCRWPGATRYEATQRTRRGRHRVRTPTRDRPGPDLVRAPKHVDDDERRGHSDPDHLCPARLGRRRYAKGHANCRSRALDAWFGSGQCWARRK